MSDHQKRLSAPRTYPIDRKEGTYIAKGEGPHPIDAGLPLVVVLRDLLEYADSESEVKDVLSQEKVLVDGRVRRNPQYTVGFMDVISFPDIDEEYRMLLNAQGFVLQEAGDAETKLVRVEDKTTLKGGVTQLNLHDGNNIETDDGYDTKSSLVVTVPDLDVEDEIAFEEGNTAYITGGQHAGTVATVTDIRKRPGGQERRILLETDDGEQVETVESYVYMIGEDGPEVDIDA